MSLSPKLEGHLRLLGSTGANRAMEAELKRLASRSMGGRLPKPRRPTEQSLVYPFCPELAWLAVRYARTPSRVLWDVLEIRAERLEPLYESVLGALDQRPSWMQPDLSFSVEVRRAEAFAAGPLQVRGAVKNALMDASVRLGCPLRLDAETPDLLFRVEAQSDRVRLSIDLGGRSLHRRGVRTQVSEASLKETLAAQILILARWNPRVEALIDPMAGAGTLVLEGAAVAQGAPVWTTPARPPVHRLSPFAHLDQDAPPLFPGALPYLVSIEAHTPAHRALLGNLSAANLTSEVRAFHADFRDIPYDMLVRGAASSRSMDKGLVIVNPPYGERLERGRGQDPDLEDLYEDLRDWWRSLGPGWRIAVLGPGPPLRAVFGGHPKLDKPMRNGPLWVSLLVYEP